MSSGEESDAEEMGDGVLHASRGPNKNDMAADYMPEPDHWGAKTVLDPHDPGAVAALGQFGVMFPEVDDLQPVIDGVLATHLPAKTSVKGRSRDEYKDILMSMFGGKGTIDETRAWVDALGANESDD